MIFALMILLILVLIGLGLEVAWAIGVGCLFFLVTSQVSADLRDVPMVLFSQQMTVGLDSFTLLAIPLFIMAGLLMSASGVTQRLIRFASAYVGHLHGGLANVAVTSNFALSGMSGSAIADASATGVVLIPEMKRKGYPATFAAAVVAVSSTIAPIIPPSILLVLLGAIMNLSVGRLFLGGVVPGLIMFAGIFLLTYLLARTRGYVREPRASWRERLAATWQAVLPILAPFVILRAMMSGMATPTEAAAILVLYVLLLGLVVYRTLTPARIFHCAAHAGVLTAAIMLIVATSAMFTWVAVQQRFGTVLVEAMLALTDNVYILLLLTNLLLLVLGMFIDALPVMLLLAPILFPMFESMGVDPIQLGVMMVFNLSLGLLTPPVGLCLNIAAMIAGSDVIRVFRDALPYLLLLVGVLMAITFIPQVVTMLPNLMMD